ncbi:serine/threonine-protein kinase Nek8-like isoform X3 [Haemaphysalis longicornis]
MDDYEKIEVVGRGAFGVVTLYLQKSTQRKVVIKHIPVQQMSAEEKEGSVVEAKVLAMLHHPNIIAYYDSFLEEKSLAIVMEYAPGGTLCDYLKQRGRALLSEKEVLHYFGQLVLALEHVHSRQILHRDLKTQNLLLNQSRSIVKVGDFGISKILNSKSKAESLVGTPNNLSPEICKGQPYNQKSDIWALGCILYELMTLKSAFQGDHVPTIMMKILKGSYEPVPDRYSAALRGLLDQMLQREPSLRPTVRQLWGHPVLLPVIVNLCLTIGSLPCVADVACTHSHIPTNHSLLFDKGDLPTSLLFWERSNTVATATRLEVSSEHGPITEVAAGLDYIVAITADGSALAWEVAEAKKTGQGKETYELKILKDKPVDRIIHASCGADFIILLSERKMLLSFGRGQSGSLGHGCHSDEKRPKIVEALLGHKIMHVACAASHVLAIDESHDVYAWGDARHGMLGIDFSLATNLPVKLELPEGIRPTCCFCTSDSSYLVTDAGELWACGSNRNGKLGIKNGGADVERFTQVPQQLYMGNHVIQVSGNEGSTIILTDVGMVFLLGMTSSTSKSAISRMVSLEERATHIGCVGSMFVAVIKEIKLVQWKQLNPDNSPVEIIPAPQLPQGVKVTSLACSTRGIVAVVTKRPEAVPKRNT